MYKHPSPGYPVADITLRLTKGDTLTFGELDSNFTNLNTDKLEAPLSGGDRVVPADDPIVFAGAVTVEGAFSIGTDVIGVDVDDNITINGTPLAIDSGIVFNKIVETVQIVASAPSATTNIDVRTAQAWYHTVDATVNFTLNVRGTSSEALNALMSTGQSCPVLLMITNGATPYIPSTIQVDGVTQTVKWVEATAPTGNASSIDAYVLSIIKTGNNAFTVLGSFSKFA